MVKTRNVSLPDELSNYLDQNPELSPSKILQAAIIQIRNNREFLIEKFKSNEIQLQAANSFLIHKELWEEYKEWRSGSK